MYSWPLLIIGRYSRSCPCPRRYPVGKFHQNLSITCWDTLPTNAKLKWIHCLLGTGSPRSTRVSSRATDVYLVLRWPRRHSWEARCNNTLVRWWHAALSALWSRWNSTNHCQTRAVHYRHQPLDVGQSTEAECGQNRATLGRHQIIYRHGASLCVMVGFLVYDSVQILFLQVSMFVCWE